MKRVNANTWTEHHEIRQNVRGYGRRKVWCIVTAQEIRRSDGLVLGEPRQYGFLNHTHRARTLVMLTCKDIWWDAGSLLHSEVVDLVITE